MSKDLSGPAFPGVEYSFYDGMPQVSGYYVGMTKREVIAMHAMAGLLASNSQAADWMEPKQSAEMAVEYADALLAELGRE